MYKNWPIIVVIILFISILIILDIRDKDNKTLLSDAAKQDLPLTSESNMNTDTKGLQIEVVTPGTGEGVRNGQTAVVNYTGSLTDGTVFDSSIPRGEPFVVHLGLGEVIQGWDLGILGMKIGETRRLTIAPALAYGERGYPNVIPPNATLIFDVTLLEIQ